MFGEGRDLGLPVSGDVDRVAVCDQLFSAFCQKLIDEDGLFFGQILKTDAYDEAFVIPESFFVSAEGFDDNQIESSLFDTLVRNFLLSAEFCPPYFKPLEIIFVMGHTHPVCLGIADTLFDFNGR